MIIPTQGSLQSITNGGFQMPPMQGSVQRQGFQITAPTQGFRQATPTRPIQQVPPQVGGPKRYTLPPIDRSRLLTPGQVVDKYPQLITHKRITRFAVRLAQEAYFGRGVMGNTIPFHL